MGSGILAKVQTLVSVGPYRLKKAADGHRRVSLLKCFTGKTSPANKTVRREPKSRRSRLPNSAIRPRIEGVEYHTVRWFTAIKRARSRGFFPSSSEIKNKQLPCLRER